MDQKWMSANRLSEEYKNGVDFFLRFCLENGGDPNFTCCPCLKCFKVTKLSFNKIKEHLFFNGIDRSYKIWYSHGEKPPNIPDPPSRISKVRRNRDEVNWDSLDEMIDDAHYGSTVDLNKFETLLSDAEKPIYPDCKRFTKLSTLLRLFNLKAKHGWSDRSLTELLSFLKELLPECNEMPMSFYEAKKTICSLGMEYEKIHACPNDCILYRNRFSDAESCPTCGESRWKKKRNGEDVKEGIPAKVLWYLPPIPRFIRLFRNAELAKSLSWHANERVKDGNDIDVYLAPLIDDLKTLWNEGVRVYDAYKQEEFTLRAALLWTINNFPAYGNLSDFSVKGYKACPICEEETCSQYLKHSRKVCYMGHRKFLKSNHILRTWKKAFNGEQEFGEAPRPLSGSQVLEKMSKIIFKMEKSKVSIVKKRKGRVKAKVVEEPKSCYKKKSIFFELEYWKLLLVRHNLDVMHVEKNVVNDLRNPLNNVSDIIKWICRGPSLNVTKFSSYMVNGTKFTTMERDKNRNTQNSGVSLIATTFQVSTSKDRNPIECDMSFYGVIKEIWELDYIITQVPVFFCDWVKSDSGVKKEDLGFTLVNLNLLGHKTD
ncbi:uncharacterized protein LOC133805968 [Humulus lupulus]|uniref:uncharacterized protein LOC133805968 n=1 Tax=Humulus lupulus TaxID=3486 RepID=UPI002B415D04|nr:uncharacterized protein LOC133805968 [Humulus lupulus]